MNYTAVARKEYFLQAGTYTYFCLNPDFAWDITDRIQWSMGFRSKWIVYDELDAGGLPKDLTSLQARTELTLRLLRELKLILFLQGVFANESPVLLLNNVEYNLHVRLDVAGAERLLL